MNLPPPAKRRLLFKFGLASLFVFLAALIWYGHREASRLEFNPIEIPEKTLPSLKGLKILVISDIHDDERLLEEAICRGLEQKPDLAFIVGDLIDATNRTSRTRRLIEPLKKLNVHVPTFACMGNHDIERPDTVRHIYKSAGVRLLHNEQTSVYLPRLGKSVTIAGLGEWWDDDFFPERCLSLENISQGKEPVIILNHNPTTRSEIREYAWNLMISGHTHGSQIRYPITGKAVFTRDGDPLTEGLHHPFPGKSIFITRGVGSALSLRFNCPPEFNILTIH